MKFKKYFGYFRFIQRNWNTYLAAFSIYHEVKGEKKYGINTTTIDDLMYTEVLTKKNHAYIYQGVNYFMLEKAFDYVKEAGYTGGLVDFGCGKGRILTVAAHYGFTNITGVEFAPALCQLAEENLKKVHASFPDAIIKIYCQDAQEFSIKPTDCILTFFNPFDKVIMLPVVKNIMQSYREFPRDMVVCYFNPTEKEIFLSAGFQESWYYKKMNYLDMSILTIKPIVMSDES